MPAYDAVLIDKDWRAQKCTRSTQYDIPLRPAGILFYVLRISSEWGLLGRNTRSAIRGTSSHPNLGEELIKNYEF